MNQKEKDIICSWASDLGIQLSGHQIHLLDIYLAELREWNKRINLTSLSSRQAIMKELLLDSLIPLPFLPHKGRLLDVGSGAGFPAIPLKICGSQLRFHLAEANSKKVNFLKHVIRLMKLSDIKVIRGRIEHGRNILDPDGYHVITARALAKLPQALMWCVPHLMSGGMIFSFQGSQFEKALKESSDLIKRCRLILFKNIPYILPGKGLMRHVLIFKKS